MERCIRKPFHPLAPRYIYHGGHRFHPYGRHDTPWFMVHVLACSLWPCGDASFVHTIVYLHTYLVATPVFNIVVSMWEGALHTNSYMS